MARPKSLDKMSRIHITMPAAVLALFKEYGESQQNSISAFLTKAGLNQIRRHRGDWKDRADRVTNPRHESITKEEFQAMSTDEKRRWLEQWR